MRTGDPLKRSEPSTLGAAMFLLWGLIVWGLQFTFVYVAHTWLCALGAREAGPQFFVIAATVIAAGLIAPAVVAPARLARLAGLEPGRPDTGSLIVIARLIAVISLIAAVWTGLAVAIVGACLPGR